VVVVQTADIRGDYARGHIPGAVSLPYAAVVDESLHYLPADTLRARFAAAGVEPEDEIISYCYRGKAACLIYVAARLAGHEAHVFDGSFEEWRGHVELPLEVSHSEDQTRPVRP
jgi:thiosulfate/3-mercaptopyruvate sulfurtransferase